MLDRRAFLSTALVLAACRRRSDATADPGVVIARIVSVSASTTETLFAIGAGALVVGRSRYCDYPPEVLALPAVGGYTDPNLEAILALRPDLVVGARGPIGPGLTRALEDHGIGTYFPETESFEAIAAMIGGMGSRTGHGEEAARLVKAMRDRRAAIDAVLAPLAKPRVLLLFSVRPITAAGPASFPDEMLRLAGATNALTDGASYPTLGLDRVLALDPDFVLDAEMGGSVADLGETWSDLRAVREGRVSRIADETVLRPGPRVLDGVAVLASVVHPGVHVPA